MTENPEHGELAERLNDLLADLSKEAEAGSETLRLLCGQGYEEREPKMFMYALGKQKGREEALHALSALIMTQTDDLAGEIASFLDQGESEKES